MRDANWYEKILDLRFLVVKILNISFMTEAPMT